MKEKLEAVRQLAKLAVESEATKESLTRIADTLRDALGAAQVFFVYAEDRDLITCGDSRSGDDVGAKPKGIWLMQ
jgi:hypothetical protein